MKSIIIAFIEIGEKNLVLIKADDDLIVNKKRKSERQAFREKLKGYFPNLTIVLFNEDKWGIKSFYCNNTLANKLANFDFSHLKWESFQL